MIFKVFKSIYFDYKVFLNSKKIYVSVFCHNKFHNFQKKFSKILNKSQNLWSLKLVIKMDAYFQWV